MRINQIIEAKFSKPITAFHGTTTTFLKSILKHGMIPNPKNKKWDNDPNARIDRHSLVSLTGTYWTTNLYTATAAASNITKKFNGNPLYVIANIQLGSAKSDEDDIMPSLEREYIYALKQFTNPEFTHYLISLFTENPDLYQQAKEIFIKEFHNYLTKNKNKPIPKKLLSDTFDANTFRKFAYDYNLIEYELEDIKTRAKKYNKIIKIPNIPNKQEAEETLKNIKEKLTTYYTEPTQNNFDQKFRITDPITFRGNNRITHIIEQNEKTLILHYGNAKTLPKQFLDQVEHTFGKITILNKNNEPIEPEE